MIPDHDTIVAPATAAGGAIAVVRVSGREAFALCDRVFRGRKPLAEADGYTVHYGEIMDGDRIVDDVLAAVFRAPHSYTGEDSVEISCHGSSYIVSEILRLLTAAGGRMAQPGEFTIRAYLAGKLDLSQAEAVADTIAASSRAAHALASTQMRGGYSDELERLRDKLLNLTSLLELELDFSEEDVEFADRTALRETMQRIGAEIDRLRSSFSLGNAIKEGVAVAIVGAPNVGKSTLLNRLLNEERAMVSEIAGTTRDVIEERANIGGILFRFLDTAGIRSTDDRLERMGIERTMESIRRAQLVIHLIDASALAAAVPEPDFARSRSEAPDRRKQNRPGSRVADASRKHHRHLGETGHGPRPAVRSPAPGSRYRRTLPRRSGRFEQPPLRSPHDGPRGSRPGSRRLGQRASRRLVERRDPPGHPRSRFHHRPRHHRPRRSPSKHLFEILRRKVTQENKRKGISK